jgi:DeoR family transcriptional regulator of aga operon/DeoR family fructose operon transcriptional repressor
MQRAQRTIVLADHTKLGRVALHSIAPISSMHTLITDHDASPTMLAELKELDIDVCLP